MSKWQYLAGLVDGDGSIFISKRGVTSCGGHGYYRLTLSVANCNLTLLEYLKKTFGKSCIIWQSQNYHAGHITWEGPKAKETIRKILPYLVGKKEQANLALKFPTLGKGAPGIKKADLPKFHKTANDMFEKMSALNAKWSMGKVLGARKLKPKEVMMS